MRFIFLGAPGVGKGTQAAVLSRKYRIPHIATGNLLRWAVSEKTPVGLEAQAYIEAGKLVPDHVIIALVRDRLSEPDAESGYILDGFPRTIAQGEALDAMLLKKGQQIDRVFYFVLDDAAIMERIVGRRSCPKCQAVYHAAFNPPPREGVCACGMPLVQRKDDRPETVKARLATYRDETVPLIRYYREEGRLVEVPAGGTLEAVRRLLDNAFQECVS